MLKAEREEILCFKYFHLCGISIHAVIKRVLQRPVPVRNDPKKQGGTVLYRKKSPSPESRDCAKGERHSRETLTSPSLQVANNLLEKCFFKKICSHPLTPSICSFIQPFTCCVGSLNTLLLLSLQCFCHCYFLVLQLPIDSSASISDFETASPYLQLTLKLSWFFNEEISLLRYLRSQLRTRWNLCCVRCSLSAQQQFSSHLEEILFNSATVRD